MSGMIAQVTVSPATGRPACDRSGVELMVHHQQTVGADVEIKAHRVAAEKHLAHDTVEGHGAVGW